MTSKARNTPRPSNLSFGNPLGTPAVQLQPETPDLPRLDSPTVAVVAAATESETVKPRQGSARETPKKELIGVYVWPDQAAHARGAFQRTNTPEMEGVRTFSDFIAQAVMTEVARLEKMYNEGREYPPIAKNQLSKGRPYGT